MYRTRGQSSNQFYHNLVPAKRKISKIHQQQPALTWLTVLTVYDRTLSQISLARRMKLLSLLVAGVICTAAAEEEVLTFAAGYHLFHLSVKL